MVVLTQDIRGGAGAERVVSNLSRALSPRVEFVFVYPQMARLWDQEFQPVGRTHQLELRWHQRNGGSLRKAARYFSRVHRLAGVIRAERPDVVLSNFSFMFHQLVGIVKALHLAPIRVVLRFGNPASAQWGGRGRWSEILMRLSLRTADRIVACSAGIAEELHEALGVSKSKLTVINNPIDVEEVTRLAQAEVIEIPRDGQPLILSVGRLSAQKNESLLIRAFARVRQEREVRLGIVGTGELDAELKGLVDELRLGNDVIFLGWQDNPYRFMRLATCLVLSSDYEGFGNVLVEAMACGCPVISTDCPYGPAEILAGGKYGILVPVGDEEELSRAILDLLGNERLRSRLAESGPGRAKSFSMDVIAPGYLEVFEQLSFPSRGSSPCRDDRA